MSIEYVEVWGGMGLEVHDVRGRERHVIGFMSRIGADPEADNAFLSGFAPAARRWRQKQMSKSVGGSQVELAADAEEITWPRRTSS